MAASVPNDCTTGSSRNGMYSWRRASTFDVAANLAGEQSAFPQGAVRTAQCIPARQNEVVGIAAGTVLGLDCALRHGPTSHSVLIFGQHLTGAPNVIRETLVNGISGPRSLALISDKRLFPIPRDTERATNPNAMSQRCKGCIRNAHWPMATEGANWRGHIASRGSP